MKQRLTLLLLLVTFCSQAEDLPLSYAGEFVSVTSKQAIETKPMKDIPGRERMLDRISIKPSPDSNPTFYIVSGRVVSGNTGAALERIAVYIGSEETEPRLAALTNIDGEFKFSLRIHEEQSAWGIRVAEDLSGYLYLGSGGGRIESFEYPEHSNMTVKQYRRYSLKRLYSLSKQ
ncbi:MAG: hypothetical protein AAF571_02905 [Verrucomicrobiota bacterium]